MLDVNRDDDGDVDDYGKSFANTWAYFMAHSHLSAPTYCWPRWGRRCLILNQPPIEAPGLFTEAVFAAEAESESERAAWKNYLAQVVQLFLGLISTVTKELVPVIKS